MEKSHMESIDAEQADLGLTVGIFLFLSVLSTLFVLYPLADLIAEMASVRAEAFAERQDAVLYDRASHLSLFAAWLGLIALSGGLALWLMVPDMGCQHFRIRSVVGLGLGLCISALVLLDHELKSHGAISNHGYLRASYLPWRSADAHTWPAARRVELGCDPVRGVTYRVTFRSGVVANLHRARPLEGSWLDAVELIDRRLRSTDVHFVRWSRVGRAPRHARCLSLYRRVWSQADFQRLQALLRVGHFPGD